MFSCGRLGRVCKKRCENILLFHSGKVGDFSFFFKEQRFTCIIKHKSEEALPIFVPSFYGGEGNNKSPERNSLNLP